MLRTFLHWPISFRHPLRSSRSSKWISSNWAKLLARTHWKTFLVAILSLIWEKTWKISRCRISCQKFSQENLTLARTKFDEGRVLMNNFFSKAGVVLFENWQFAQLKDVKSRQLWWIHCFHCQIDTSVGLNPSDVPWQNLSILSKKLNVRLLKTTAFLLVFHIRLEDIYFAPIPVDNKARDTWMRSKIW